MADGGWAASPLYIAVNPAADEVQVLIKRHTKISSLSLRLLYLNINPLHSNIPPIS